MVVSVVESSAEAVVASTVVDFSVVGSPGLLGGGTPGPVLVPGDRVDGTGPETNRLRMFHGYEGEALQQFVPKTLR